MLLLLFVITCFGIDLQVDSPIVRTGGVGVVDMEKVYREYPETQKLKQEFFQKTLEKKKELQALEMEIEKIKFEIKELENKKSQLQTQADTIAQTIVSTETAFTTQTTSQFEQISITPETLSEIDSQIQQKKKELNIKEEELKTKSDITTKELQLLEEEKNKKIIGRIYKILKEIAQENNLSLIVDKNYILYGTPSVDLTKELQQRLSK